MRRGSHSDDDGGGYFKRESIVGGVVVELVSRDGVLWCSSLVDFDAAKQAFKDKFEQGSPFPPPKRKFVFSPNWKGAVNGN